MIKLIIMSILLLPTHAYGDECTNPQNLPPNLKKAYDELKKASEELGGFSVSVRCFRKDRVL